MPPLRVRKHQRALAIDLGVCVMICTIRLAGCYIFLPPNINYCCQAQPHPLSKNLHSEWLQPPSYPSDSQHYFVWYRKKGFYHNFSLFWWGEGGPCIPLDFCWTYRIKLKWGPFQKICVAKGSNFPLANLVIKTPFEGEGGGCTIIVRAHWSNLSHSKLGRFI